MAPGPSLESAQHQNGWDIGTRKTDTALTWARPPAVLALDSVDHFALQQNVNPARSRSGRSHAHPRPFAASTLHFLYPPGRKIPLPGPGRRVNGQSAFNSAITFSTSGSPKTA